MIRKAIIFALGSMALSSFAIYIIGHWMPFETCILSLRNGTRLGFRADRGFAIIRFFTPVHDDQMDDTVVDGMGPEYTPPYRITLSEWRVGGSGYSSRLHRLLGNSETLTSFGCTGWYERTSSQNALHFRTISVWLIPVSTIFAAYPTIAFIRGPLRRYRRRKRGLCVRCGYNLEGNVSGVCPECGEAR